MDAFFSVIIPTYKRAKLIGKAIQSVLNQKFREWELIIVDDASGDNTAEVVEAFGDDRIIFIQNEINLERSASRNKGIEIAKGRYICFLDSDDRWSPDHLEIIHKTICDLDFESALFFTGLTYHYPDAEKTFEFSDPEGKNAVEYLVKNQIAPSGVCVEKSILKQFQFKADVVVNEDVDLFTRIASRYPIRRIRAHTLHFLVHEENTMGQFKDYISPQIKVFKCIASHEPTAGFISESFRKERLQYLRRKRIFLFKERKIRGKLFWYGLAFLMIYPSDGKRKEIALNLWDSLPGARWIRRKLKKTQ